MVELAILSGRRASAVISIDRFPCTLGRSGADVELDEPGIAPRHATLTRDPTNGFQLEALGKATVYCEGRNVLEMHLRNGELFELGGVRLQFRLSPARARNLAWLDQLAAAAVVGVFGAEIVWILISSSWP